jgi:hypothetical protein
MAKDANAAKAPAKEAKEKKERPDKKEKIPKKSAKKSKATGSTSSLGVMGIAKALPFLVVLLAAVAKFGFARFVSMNVVGPAPAEIKGDELTTLLSGRSLLCVGCTRGIGAGIARAACSQGSKVTIVGRNHPGRDKLEDHCTGEGKMHFISADLSKVQWAGDLSSKQSMLEVVESLPTNSIDTVVFTVGMVNGPERKVSEEGIELEVPTLFLPFD